MRSKVNALYTLTNIDLNQFTLKSLVCNQRPLDNLSIRDVVGGE